MRAKYVSVQIASAIGVADRWASSYRKGGGKDGWGDFRLACGKSAKKIHDQLLALGDTPDLAKVAEIIGNRSWSYIACDGCNDSVERAICLGEYEAKTYCVTCIREAAEILKEEQVL